MFNLSNKNLDKIYPLKFNQTKRKSGILSSTGNKLRSSGNEIFYIVKNTDDDNWSDVFSEEVRGDFDEHFNEDNTTLQKILKIMKTLRNNGDNRFDYNDLIIINKYGKGGITIDEVRRRAVKSNTPYIRFDEVYHKELGVISINLYEFLNNNKKNN